MTLNIDQFNRNSTTPLESNFTPVLCIKYTIFKEEVTSVLYARLNWNLKMLVLLREEKQRTGENSQRKTKNPYFLI